MMIFDLNQALWLVRRRRLSELLEVLEHQGYEGESAIAVIRRIQLEFATKNV
jgi:hypothetical protein